MTIPFALSVHKFINQVGSDVGFASIIGLALLVLLYFAQARETSTLRERLEEAQNRVGTLENRLGQLLRAQQAPPAAAGPARPPVAPAPALSGRPMGSTAASVPRGPGTAAVAGGEAALVRSGAPAGLAAPALGASTKLIPDPVPASVGAGAARGTVTAAKPVQAVVASGGGGASPPRAAGVATPAPDEDTMFVPPTVVPPATATATAAAGGNGRTLPPVAPPAPPPRVRIAPDETIPPVPPQRALPPLRPGAERSPSLLRRIVPVIIGLAAVAIVVVALLTITGSGSSPKTVVHHPHPAPAKAAAFSPSKVDVAVLNGTAVNGLAKAVGADLSGAGYDVPAATIANAAAQTETTTNVGYTTGHRADARHVATALKLPASAVSPASAAAIQSCATAGTTNGTATTPSTTCPADVIVTIGTDLAGDATSATGGP